MSARPRLLQAAAISLAAAGVQLVQPAFAQQPIEIQVAPPSGAPRSAQPQAAPAPVQAAPAAAAPAGKPRSDDEPLQVAPVDDASVAAGSSDGDSGTTIVGDQEAPIGLYITPWKNDFVDHLDRPARFVDVDTKPIDPDVFHRRVEYYDTITAYRNAHLANDSK